MIKRICHLSDIHIRTYNLHEQYKKQFTDLIDQLKIQFLGSSKDEVRICIVGDLLHQKITISNEQIVLVSCFLN